MKHPYEEAALYRRWRTGVAEIPAAEVDPVGPRLIAFAEIEELVEASPQHLAGRPRKDQPARFPPQHGQSGFVGRVDGHCAHGFRRSAETDSAIRRVAHYKPTRPACKALGQVRGRSGS